MLPPCTHCRGSQILEDDTVVCLLCSRQTYVLTPRQQQMQQEIEDVKAELRLHPMKRGAPLGTKHRSKEERITRLAERGQSRTERGLQLRRLAVYLHRQGYTHREVGDLMQQTATNAGRLIIEGLADERLGRAEPLQTLPAPPEIFAEILLAAQTGHLLVGRA